MQKQYLLLFLLFSCCIYGKGQAVNYQEKVAFDNVELNSSTWDVESKSVVDDYPQFDISISDAGIYKEKYGNKIQLYLLKCDTLYYRGFTIGRTIGASVDTSSAIVTFPLLESDSKQYSLRQSVFQMSEFAYQAEVNTKTEYIKRGKLIIGSDTLSTILMKEQRNAIAYVVKDSSTVTVPYEELIFRWYTDNSYIPIAIQCKFQEWTAPRLFVKKNIQASEFTTDDVSPDIESIIEEALINIDNKSVSVTLGYAPTAIVDISIVDLIGNIYGHSSGILDAAENTFTINTGDIPHGSYMLVITISGEIGYTKKQIIVL